MHTPSTEHLFPFLASTGLGKNKFNFHFARNERINEQEITRKYRRKKVTFYGINLRQDDTEMIPKYINSFLCNKLHGETLQFFFFLERVIS